MDIGRRGWAECPSHDAITAAIRLGLSEYHKIVGQSVAINTVRPFGFRTRNASEKNSINIDDVLGNLGAHDHVKGGVWLVKFRCVTNFIGKVGRSFSPVASGD